MSSETLRTTLALLARGRALEREQARRTFDALAAPEAPASLKGAVLGAIAARGESGRELAGFARAMLDRAVGPVPHAGGVLLDTCGTGGDGSGSFNLSTAAALLLAAAGVPVAKHGNRSVSSPCGSADLIEELGIPFARDPARAGEELRERGFTFLYARSFHPAAAGISEVRRDLGVRTIFNILGPLVNPARPTHQLTGTGDRSTAGHMAQALSMLDVERAFVVVGARGWDEATQVGPFHLLDVRPGAVEERVLTPGAFGLPPCSPGELAGAGPEENARLLREVFDPASASRSALRDAVLLNGALCLLLLEAEASPRDAVARLRATIDAGTASAYLDRLRTESTEATR